MHEEPGWSKVPAMAVQPSGAQATSVQQLSERSDTRPRRRHRRDGLSRRLLRKARYRRATRLVTALLLAGVVVAVTLYLAWRFSIHEPPPAYLYG